MKDLLFTWKVWERNGNVSFIKTPFDNAAQTQIWLWKEKNISTSSLKRILGEWIS